MSVTLPGTYQWAFSTCWVNLNLNKRTQSLSKREFWFTFFWKYNQVFSGHYVPGIGFLWCPLWWDVSAVNWARVSTEHFLWIWHSGITMKRRIWEVFRGWCVWQVGEFRGLFTIRLVRQQKSPECDLSHLQSPAWQVWAYCSGVSPWLSNHRSVTLIS